MNIVVNWPTVAMAGIVLGIGLVAAASYLLLESMRIRSADRQQRRQFERDMQTTELPAYDGETYDVPAVPEWRPAPPAPAYDWTAESLAYLSDRVAYDPAPTRPIPVVPNSTLSGPLPVVSTRGIDDFMDRLRAENAEFLARLEAQGA